MTEEYVSFRRLLEYHATVNKTLKGIMELTNKVLGELGDEIALLKSENESLKTRLKSLEDTDFTTEDLDNNEYDNI